MAYGLATTGGGVPMQTVGGPQTFQQTTGPSAYATNIGAGSSSNQASSSTVSSTYIPDYLESPILREAAQYARSMAPQIYDWGMQQFNKQQGNIDAMMRNALTYASPQRIAMEMGQAQAGVMQGAEAGRQSSIKDLQSYGIDPSSGRYASLDQANRVMAGAQAAGAGNVQREATIASGLGQQQTAEGLSLQNVGTGYGAANAANQYLANTMSLKFPPLGSTSTSSSQSSGSSQQTQAGSSTSGGASSVNVGFGDPLSQARATQTTAFTPYMTGNLARSTATYQSPHVQEGGYIPPTWSPSGGARTDDVPANLNAGEFVIPKDVSEWMGQKFFYDLMAKSRAARAKSSTPPQQTKTGYQSGGDVGGNIFQYLGLQLPGSQQFGPSGVGYAPVGAERQAQYEADKAAAAKAGMPPPAPPRYRELTPPRMGTWGPGGGPVGQSADVRQYPELYGGTRGGWQPWNNPGDIGRGAGGAWTAPIDTMTGQPIMADPASFATDAASLKSALSTPYGGRVGADLARQDAFIGGG